MYRRDFTAVADLIKEQLDSHDPAFDQAARDSIARIARSMADLFMCRNQRFDRQRFYRAAGLDEQGRAPGLIATVDPEYPRGMYLGE